MARPRNADGRRTRQAILDAASTLFSQKGYFGTSLREVGATVGVRESALYNYFPSKEALFDALLTRDAEIKIEQLSAFLEQPLLDARAALTRLATQLLEGFSTPQAAETFRILLSDGIRLARDGRINFFERMASRSPRLEEVMRRLIVAGALRNGDPAALAVAFFGPLIIWRHVHAIGAKHPMTENPCAFVRTHVDLFLTGAGSPPPSAATRRRTRRD